MTLEPVDSHGWKIHFPTHIHCITIREHQDVFEPLECLPLLEPCKDEVGIWLRPFFWPLVGYMLSFFLSHSFSYSALALTSLTVLFGMVRGTFVTKMGPMSWNWYANGHDLGHLGWNPWMLIHDRPFVRIFFQKLSNSKFRIFFLSTVHIKVIHANEWHFMNIISFSLTFKKWC